VGRRLVLVVSLAAALFAPAQARAAIPLVSCGATGVQCGTVVAPLDYSGRTPGTVALHVEVLPAQIQPVGTMFLIAGGPGQGSAGSFNLALRTSVEEFQTAFPAYRLVAFDNRGTGKSGLIDCPDVQKAVDVSVEQERVLTRQCADLIGPTRQFYATRDHAEDIESVRTALGLGKIGLYGVSYGTKLSLAYALAHPGNVDRIVLDSVVPPTYPDPFDRPVLQEMAGTLNTFCAGGRCKGATSSYAADVAAVANRLEAKPATGTVVLAGGGKRTVHMNGEDLLSVIIDSDLNPGLAAELPAAVHAARGGFMRPLLRLFDFDVRSSNLSAEDLSFGLNVATNCADGRFPWSPDTPVSARQSLWSAAVAAQPAGAFGSFGLWAARIGTASLCLEWPSPAGSTPLGPGPFPNVPLLALNGGYDLRTPVANAVAIVNQFPQGHLIVVPGVGHSVFTADFSQCAAETIRQWIRGATLPRAAACPRVPPFVETVTAFPKTAAKTAAATAAIVAKTLHEGEAAWGETIFSGAASAAGLYGGKVVPGASGFALTRYSLAPGFVVTGKLKFVPGALPLGFAGTVRVSGPKAVAGTLTVTRTKLTGKLGGRRVSVGL
jgi:pimeloyl-ACP methyl ester carboxylesterase